MKTHILIFSLTFFGVLVLSQSQGQVYCGRRLASTLAILCDNNFIKRSVPQYGLIKVSQTPYHEEPSLSWPWIASQRAHSVSRGKRQVVSECCDKPCSIDELLSYCGY